jgi:hypothetical protein
MRRRTLLTAGAAGGTLLAIGGVALVAGRDPLADRERVMAAVVPAILEGALPESAPDRAKAVRRCIDGVGIAVAALPPASRRELDRLFALLASPPGRRLLAGVRVDWPQAPQAEVSAFLEDWRLHRLALLRAGYAALHDLVLGSWYADPAAWSAIGYGGPLALVSEPSQGDPR